MGILYNNNVIIMFYLFINVNIYYKKCKCKLMKTLLNVYRKCGTRAYQTRNGKMY